MRDQNKLKRTKPPMELVPLVFVAAMANVMAAGLKAPGRWVDSWKELDPADLPLYRAAVLRHLKAEEEAGPFAIDADSNEAHWVHIATSAMIAWWLSKKARGLL